MQPREGRAISSAPQLRNWFIQDNPAGDGGGSRMDLEEADGISS